MGAKGAAIVAFVVAFVALVSILFFSMSSGIDSTFSNFGRTQTESNVATGADSGVWYATRLIQQDASWSYINADKTTESTYPYSVNGSSVSTVATMTNTPSYVDILPSSMSVAYCVPIALNAIVYGADGSQISQVGLTINYTLSKPSDATIANGVFTGNASPGSSCTTGSSVTETITVTSISRASGATAYTVTTNTPASINIVP